MSHAHIHTLRHAPPFSQSAYTNSKPKVTWHNAFSVSNQNVKKKQKKKQQKKASHPKDVCKLCTVCLLRNLGESGQ